MTDAGAPRRARTHAPFTRNWVVTMYGDDSPRFDEETMRFLVYQREKCPNTGRLHWQTYVVFKKQLRTKAVSNLFHNAHVEPRKGTHEEALAYCEKEESRVSPPVRFGDPSDSREASGEREKQRWDDIKKAAQEGRLDDVPSDVYVRHYRTLKDIHDDHRPKPAIGKTKRCGLWIHGVPNTGKTTVALQTFPDAYIKDSTTDYWKGYEGEEVVIIDDIHDRNKEVFRRHFRDWINTIPFRARTFYGMRLIRPSHIVCTSQEHWRALFTDPADVAALEARMDEIEFKKN